MGKKKRELERFPWLKGETLSRDDKAFGTFDLHLARKKGGWISFKFPLVSDEINSTLVFLLGQQNPRENNNFSFLKISPSNAKIVEF